jgi:predicted phage terminase large subunit-like protein
MTLPILKSNVWNKTNENELAPWLLDKDRGEHALAKAKARRHLLDFIELDGYPYWKRAKHLELLCSKLEDVERYIRGDTTGLARLIVTMPPRHGKSHVISKKYPAWFLARNPDIEIILSTYGAELAQDHSEIARDTFREWAPQLWNLNLSEKTQAKAKWKVANHRGGMAAVGIGGAATGRGAGLLIIDDPVENAESAMSPTMQEKIWNWWQTVSYTRLSPTGAVVILMTRWAQQDLVGKILEFDKESERPQNWEVLNLPAICEEENDPIGRAIGDVLWPERFSTDWILDKKANTDAFWWQSMWQQKPADITNQVFKPEDMKLIDPAIVNLGQCNFYGACDASEGGNDYAVIAIVAVLPDKRWVVWNADISVDNQSTTIEKLVKFSMQYRFKRFWIEQNSLGHAKSAVGKSNFEHRLIEQLQKSNTTLPYIFEWNSENKINRIRSLEPYYIQGKLLFRSDHHQVYKLLTEQLRFFPYFQHDDAPDALELCIRGVVKETTAVMLPKVPKTVIRVGGGWTG